MPSSPLVFLRDNQGIFFDISICAEPLHHYLFSDRGNLIIKLLTASRGSLSSNKTLYVSRVMGISTFVFIGKS